MFIHFKKYYEVSENKKKVLKIQIPLVSLVISLYIPVCVFLILFNENEINTATFNGLKST